MGVVGAVEPCAVAEDDVKGSIPPLGDEVELVHGEGARDRDIGAAVHNTRFVDLRAHSGGDGRRELRGWGCFLV